MNIAVPKPVNGVAPTKFSDPDWTAKGEQRAFVPLERLETVWINTGTLCNITCRNCYIESSPENDRLAYITAAEAGTVLNEAQAIGVREIGFTGGEPFLNPEFPAMLRLALAQGFDVLVLTNAMLPMQRPRLKGELQEIVREFGRRLTMRVSLDHFGQDLHETERGNGTWHKALSGIDWLVQNGFHTAIAGRSCWGEDMATARAGYAKLFSDRGWPIDAGNHHDLAIFPEMDGKHDVPEITTVCWGILKKSPNQMMCSSSRMVVKRKGASGPVVLPCTLLPYDEAFEMGATLSQAAKADGGMFKSGAVKLCHSHCAKFCVLGGGSCS